MAPKKQVYKCDACGNIIEVLHGADGDLVCCGEIMKLLEESSTDKGKEKHVPVLAMVAAGLKVKVGSTPHPMEEKHYIEWIEIIDGDKSCRHYLKPGEAPETVFKADNPNVTAREYTATFTACGNHNLILRALERDPAAVSAGRENDLQQPSFAGCCPFAASGNQYAEVPSTLSQKDAVHLPY